MDKDTKKSIISEHGQRSDNTGSTEVQVALLTARIQELTEHLRIHRKDHSSRRGLITLVNRRRRLLTYLRRKNPDQYDSLTDQLKIRRQR